MKKFALLVMAVIMSLSMATTAMAIAIIDEDGNIIQENEELEGGIMTLMGEIDLDFVFPAFGNVVGEVVELGETLRISTENGYFDFIVDENTFVLGEEPQLGDEITGFFDNHAPARMIYPPQHIAIVIVNRSDLPRVIVERFNEEWICSADNFHLNIGEDTEIQFQSGEAFEGDIEELIGRKLVVEFTISHRNIPETIPNPERITILYERAAPPTIDIEWDYSHDYFAYLDWDGYGFDADIDWSIYNIIITINGLSRGVSGASYATVGDSAFPNYLPLRPIAEMLGIYLNWNAENREISLTAPQGEITFRIDMPYFALQTQSGITIGYQLEPAVIIENRTYVPLSFFRDILGFNNVWWAGGNITLDNAELME